MTPMNTIHTWCPPTNTPVVSPSPSPRSRCRHRRRRLELMETSVAHLEPKEKELLKHEPLGGLCSWGSLDSSDRAACAASGARVFWKTTRAEIPTRAKCLEGPKIVGAATNDGRCSWMFISQVPKKHPCPCDVIYGVG